MKSPFISSYFVPIAEFKEEEFVEREIEIGSYLAQGFSVNQMLLKTGLKKKMLDAYLRNMMEKLKSADMDELITLIIEKQFPDLQSNNQLLKTKAMKQDTQFLQLISFTVIIVLLFSLFFSVKYFTRFYEQADQLEYLTKLPMS